jgi:hypothetical protein
MNRRKAFAKHSTMGELASAPPERLYLQYS